MSRTYHVDIARYATGVDHKWLDNLLSHYSVPGTEGGRQGIARRVTKIGVYHIVLIRRLTTVLSTRAADAVSLASRMLSSDAQSLAIGPGIELRLDRAALEREVDRLIEDAVEAVVPPRRGRPAVAVARE